MSDVHDEQAAQQAETDRLDELARQNDAVRRLEHPEEFTDEQGDEPADVAPVAPASGTGADTTDTSSSSSTTEPDTTEPDTPPADVPTAVETPPAPASVTAPAAAEVTAPDAAADSGTGSNSPADSSHLTAAAAALEQAAVGIKGALDALHRYLTDPKL